MDNNGIYIIIYIYTNAILSQWYINKISMAIPFNNQTWPAGKVSERNGSSNGKIIYKITGG